MARENQLDVRPVTPVVGAVIGGVELCKSLDPDVVRALRDAVLEHGVLFFRGQDLSREQFTAFLNNFGPLCTDPFSVAALDPPPEDQTTHDMPTYVNSRATAIWHIDSTLAAEPASLLALRALELPAGGGGDTCWGSMVAAYEALSEPLIEAVGAAEAVRIDKWESAPIRPVQRTEWYIRGFLDDITPFSDLFRIPSPDDWWSQDVRPVQRTEWYIRHFMDDIQVFDDLFAEPSVLRPLMWRGFFRRR